MAVTLKRYNRSYSDYDFIVKAPSGGFANTIILMVWLDSRWPLMIPHEQYDAVRGDDWPPLEDLWHMDHTDLPEDISDVFILDKLGHINEHIIPNHDNPSRKVPGKRTWNNWLLFEQGMRDIWQSGIFGLHNGHTARAIPKQLDAGMKVYAFTTDPNICLKHKLKFTVFGGLDYFGDIESWFEEVEQYNKDLKALVGHPNLFVADSGELMCGNELNRDIWDAMCDFGNLDASYEDANKVHAMWKQANDRAEKGYLDTIKRIYDKEYYS